MKNDPVGEFLKNVVSHLYLSFAAQLRTNSEATTKGYNHEDKNAPRAMGMDERLSEPVGFFGSDHAILESKKKVGIMGEDAQGIEEKAWNVVLPKGINIKPLTIIFLAILLSGCTQQAGQIPDEMRDIREKPLPLTHADTFLDLTERMEWTINYPAGWTSSAVSPSGLGGRVIKEDVIGLTSASLTFTTLNGAYSSRTVLDPLLESLRHNGYTDVKVVSVNDLPPPIQGTQAAEVYLSAVHAGTKVQGAWVVVTQDISDPYSGWSATALQLWAIEFPEGQARQKLPTLLAILSSAKLGETGTPVGETWYGEIAEKWMKALG